MGLRSIQGRVTRRLLVGTMTAAIAANIGTYVYLYDEVKEQYDEAIEARARALSTLVIARSIDGPISFPYAGRDQPEFRRRPGREDYFQIWDGQGKVIARSLSLGNADLQQAPVRKDTIGDRIFDAPLPDGRDGYCIEIRFAPFVSDPGTGVATSERAQKAKLDPPARLVLAVDRKEMSHTLFHLFRALAIGAIALAVASVLVVVFVVRAGLRPLRGLAEDAARVDANKLAFRFSSEDMPLELQPISQRLNDLLGRLDAAFQRERRFTADAAHELRTPIAEVRSLSEVALRWPPTTPAEHEANYRHIFNGAQQMEAVTEALLSLARQHGSAQRVRAEPIRLAEVVAEAWRSHETLAAERAILVQVTIPAELTVLADRPILIALLHNLFANAASYAPRNTTVTCETRVDRATDSTQVTSLRIANANSNLTPDDLEHLAEPFWQKDAARSDGVHAGLGLALVKEYTSTLGIRTAFTLSEDDRFVVELTWPATASLPANG